MPPSDLGTSGTWNWRSRRLAPVARSCLVDQVPIAERDFTEGRATELWAELREVGRTAPDNDRAVAAALALV